MTVEILSQTSSVIEEAPSDMSAEIPSLTSQYEIASQAIAAFLKRRPLSPEQQEDIQF